MTAYSAPTTSTPTSRPALTTPAQTKAKAEPAAGEADRSSRRRRDTVAVKRQRYRTTVRHALLGLLALLVVAFAARPTAATAAMPAGAPDVARLDAFVRDQVQRHGIPGLALGVVEGDRIVHLQGFGKADQTGRPVTPQTPFVVASVSKPLTALAVMQLVDAGTVDLEAPVQRYLPAFPGSPIRWPRPRSQCATC